MKKHCPSPSEIESILVRAGVNPTAQRLAICRYVLCEADHPTAEQVKEWADRNFPKMSLATVYNTLNLLVQAGLLKELNFPHLDKTIFDQLTTEHFHFLDESTGQLLDIPPDSIKVEHQLGKDFDIRNLDILVRGKLKSHSRI